jgi:hypothetical protein
MAGRRSPRISRDILLARRFTWALLFFTGIASSNSRTDRIVQRTSESANGRAACVHWPPSARHTLPANHDRVRRSMGKYSQTQERCWSRYITSEEEKCANSTARLSRDCGESSSAPSCFARCCVLSSPGITISKHLHRRVHRVLSCTYSHQKRGKYTRLGYRPARPRSRS